jgi:hypothetical protein
MSLNKTFIGKNGYLFLQNDSSDEIQRHIKETSNINVDSLNRYDIVQNKYFITVFPNKSYVCRSKLPEEFNLKYRSDIDVYKKKFGIYILDGYNIVGDDIETFYKTDTHMNLKGTIQIYYEFVKKIKSIFGLDVIEKICNIESKNVGHLNEVGHGDLTWWFNLGDQVLDDTTDVYHFSEDISNLYPRSIVESEHGLCFYILENNKLIDETRLVIGTPFDWNVISKYTFYKKNRENPRHRVLIFYDSFLISTLFLYLDLFDEVYLSKNVFDQNLVNVIQPTYVFEFRVERFLF